MPRTIAPLLPALCLAACVRAPPPHARYLNGEHQAALLAQQELAAIADENTALENCRLASMALAQGDEQLAEQALRRAVAIMTDFRAEGEWRAALGAEEAKDWKGEPYEKMAAFLYLGVLLFEKGDYGNALAMFKSAVLADAGTVEERYRSDFIPAYLMQALAYRAVREEGNASQSLQRAADGLYSRVLVELLSRELAEAPVEGPTDALNAARAALLTGLPAGISVAPRDPAEATRAAVSQAGDILRVQRELSRKERLPSLQDFSSADLKRAYEVLGPLAETWRSMAEMIPPPALERPARDAALLEALLADPPSLVLLVERGPGPRKTAEGRYNHILRIVPRAGPPGPPQASLQAAELSLVPLDSLAWQATTRGGRKVDGFLKGKAVFKDTAAITGLVLLELGDAAAYADNSTAAGVLYLAGLATTIAGAVANPEADTRDWGMLPDDLWLLTANPPPGDHLLTLDGYNYTVHVPAQGQIFRYIPRLPPGGDVEFP